MFLQKNIWEGTTPFVCRSNSSLITISECFSTLFYLEDGLLVVAFSRFFSSNDEPASTEWLFVNTKTGSLIVLVSMNSL
jgi:hypothetical protein